MLIDITKNCSVDVFVDEDGLRMDIFHYNPDKTVKDFVGFSCLSSEGELHFRTMSSCGYSLTKTIGTNAIKILYDSEKDTRHA